MNSQPLATHARAGHGPNLVVAVLTYRRPDDLASVIPAVLAEMDGAPCRAWMLVVDNDPQGSAMPTDGPRPGWPVVFVHEPEPGIAAARNRALDEGEAAGADLLVFLDDDERPEPGWLSAPLTSWEEGRPACVVGPVISTYAVEPEAWIVEGGFFNRRRLDTGTEVDVAATNNLLLDLGQLKPMGLRFDPAFGVTGGSDTLFTRQIHQAGGRMVWCDEARVLDVVPSGRLTRRWVLRRQMRTGNSASRVSLAIEPRAVRRAQLRAVLTVRGAARVAGGASRWVAGAVGRSTRHRACGAKTLARGLGMAGGAWGLSVSEYRRREPGS